jgi:hypothetical protein
VVDEAQLLATASMSVNCRCGLTTQAAGRKPPPVPAAMRHLSSSFALSESQVVVLCVPVRR